MTAISRTSTTIVVPRDHSEIADSIVNARPTRSIEINRAARSPFQPRKPLENPVDATRSSGRRARE